MRTFFSLLAPVATRRQPYLQVQRSFLSFWHVSSFGRVKNSRGQISSGSVDRAEGYHRVQIAVQPRCIKNFYVHRLVAFAFHGPPSSSDLVVNHIDGNRTNNRADNLEYVTQSENIQHWLKSRPAQSPQSHSSKPVMARQLGALVGKVYPSVRKAAAIVGISRVSVSRCCNGHQVACKGYEFFFVQEQKDSSREERADHNRATLQGEIWVDAVCPKTLCPLRSYQVSNQGRIQGPTGVRTYGANLKGYRRMMVRGASLLVHRIVACSFLNAPVFDCWEVNHKDGDRANNRVDNLEVVTHAENMRHAWAMRKDRGASSSTRPVKGRPLESDQWCTFKSATAAAHHVGRAASGIIACCRGYRRSCGGYEWEYDDSAQMSLCYGEEWREVDTQGLLAAWACRNKQVTVTERVPVYVAFLQSKSEFA